MRETMKNCNGPDVTVKIALSHTFFKHGKSHTTENNDFQISSKNFNSIYSKHVHTPFSQFEIVESKLKCEFGILTVL